MKPLPEVSAVTSWIDNFKMPLKEIKAKYTKSDLALIAWDSRLKNYNLSLGMKHTAPAPVASDARPSPRIPDVPDADISPRGVKETENAYILPEGVNNGVPIPKKVFDEHGEIDLRRMKGDEGAAYIRSLGIPLAYIPRR